MNYFKAKIVTADEYQRFLLLGGECNYLLHLGKDFSSSSRHGIWATWVVNLN
jgi:hypothetical protein